MPTIVPDILWTALPNGFDVNGSPKLSIHVSPRLKPNGAPGTGSGESMSDYALGNWPERVAAMAANLGALTLDFGSLAPVPAQIISTGLRPDIWDTIFKPTSKVTPHKYQDNSQRWIRSFSVRALHEYIETLYTETANASPSSFPNLRDSSGPVYDYVRVLGGEVGVIKKIRQAQAKVNPATGEVTRESFIPPLPPSSEPTLVQGRRVHPDSTFERLLDDPSTTVPAAEYFRAYRFYNRGQQEEYRSQHLERDVDAIPTPVEKPTFDVHQVMSLLADHPALLRMLGLVIDVVVPGLTVPASNTAGVRVAAAQWGPESDPDRNLRPWTRYYTKNSLFLPAPKAGGDIVEGMLALHDTDLFGVIQSDIDGSALKTLDNAVSMGALRPQLPRLFPPDPCKPSVEKPVPQSLPALRNGGFTVFRTKRDELVFDLLDRSSANNANIPNAKLEAEDVMRGYRVDVMFRGRWYSLCKRRGNYDIGDGTIVIPDQPGAKYHDEGYVKAVSATSDPPKGNQQPSPPPGDLYLHEAIFGWDNWSLVAPRPGQTISFLRDDVQKTQTMVVETPKNEPHGEFRVRPDFKVEPASLPPLRFGEPYRFRARVVDIAGNSLDLFQNNSIPAGVTPPGLGDEEIPDPGGVIIGGPINPDQPHLTPPASSYQLPFAPWQSGVHIYRRYEPVASPTIVLRSKTTEGEATERMVIRSTAASTADGQTAGIDAPPQPFGSLFNSEVDRHVAPPKTTQHTAELHGMFDALWKNPKTAYEVAKKEAGTFFDEGTLLNNSPNPDPLPENRLPGDPLGKGWYVIQPNALVNLPYLPDPLAIGASFYGFPAATATDVAAYKQLYSVAPTGWPNLQPFRLELGSGDAIAVSSDTDVMRVTVPPATILTVRYGSAMDPESLKLMARWAKMSPTAREAALAQPLGGAHWMINPWRELTFVHAVEKPLVKPTVDINQSDISRKPNDTFASVAARITNHPHSTGRLELEAHWKDPVDRLHDDGPKLEDHRGHVLHRDVEYEQTVVNVGGKEDCEPARHELGDTKHRRVHYYAVGTTRYREYFPAAFTKNPDNIQLPGIEAAAVHVPSSVRPHAPKIAYIVPTFRWRESADKKTSKRVGHGLRIYLDRPWFSSGENELLGIVIARPHQVNQAADQPENPARFKYISEWGSDPVFSSKTPNNQIRKEDFVLDPGADPIEAFGVAKNIRLAELDDTRVDVIAYEPRFNPERKLWYVDVEMDSGSSYFPFVRFGLARLQPYSVGDLHLSRVVRTDFAQLVADRTASITYDNNSIGVTVWGHAARNKLGFQANPGPVDQAPPSSGSSSSSEDPTQTQVELPLPNLPTNLFFTANPAAGAGRVVRALIERLDIPTATDLGWVPVGSEIILAPFKETGAPGTVYWRGSVPLPKSYGRDGKTYRLVVSEIEVFETDEEVVKGKPDTTVSALARTPVLGRPVYVDTFVLQS